MASRKGIDMTSDLIRYTSLGIITLEPAGDAETFLVARRHKGQVTRSRPMTKIRALRVMARISLIDRRRPLTS